MMSSSKHLRSTVCGLALVGISQVAAAHAGYSPADNAFIWQSRLDASHRAQVAAYAKCHWKPAQPSDFSDDVAVEGKPHRNQALHAELMNLLRLDQNARAASTAWPNAWTREKVGQVDDANLPKLKGIIKDGFPTVTMVGFEGANAMLMLVAHADEDLDFQKQALARLREAAKSGGVPVFFPAVLAAIRPKITGTTTTSGDHAGQAAASAATVAKPRDCYFGQYESSFNEYLSHALVARFSSEAGVDKP